MHSNELLNWIYSRTDGYCHICGKKLSFLNYSFFLEKGAWEVEHSRPKANGGSHHRNNLFAACISCNRQKGKSSTRYARSQYGRTRAPLPRQKKEEMRLLNALIGGFFGAAMGTLAGRDGNGMVLGAAIGAALGYETNVN